MFARFIATLVIMSIARLERKIDQLMDQDTQLTAVVSRLAASVATETAAIAAALQPKAADPVIAQAITSLGALADSVDAEAKQITPPAPAPNPAPGP